jgi:hypothetical protein
MVKHFLLPLMKRKNNSKLNEASQIPYRLEDFKEGDRVHIIGNFDGEEFNDLGTIVTTSNEIDNPWSHDASFLVKFDEPQQEAHDLHDGETRIDWVRNRCQNNCWWIWMNSFISDYGLGQEFELYNKRNRVIKFNLPSAYDVISSLYESTDLIKENYIYPGIKAGDEVIISIGDEGLGYGPVINEFATVVEVNEGGSLLVKFKNFNKGHDGNNDIRCGRRDCLFINDVWYEDLSVRPAESLGMPDAYDVISSLYESEDLDWASDMVNNIGKTFLRLSIIPKVEDRNYYLIIFDKPGITLETITEVVLYVKKFTIWGRDMGSEIPNLIRSMYNAYLEKGFVYLSLKPNKRYGTGSSYEAFSRVNNIKITAPSIKRIRPYYYDESINESTDDLDWASDMVNNINLTLTSIPDKSDYYFYVILFDKPGITYETVEGILNYIKESTVWFSTFDQSDLKNIAEYIFDAYRAKRFSYLALRPKIADMYTIGYGSSKSSFEFTNSRTFSDPEVKIIRPYLYGENINESEDLEWVSDMVNDVDLNSATISVITQIPTTVDPVRFHYIGFKGPGITEKNIADVVWFTEKNTNYKPFVDAANTIDNIYNLYLKNGSAYIVLKPSNQKAVGASPNAFEIINKVKMNNPKEVNVIKFIADKKINESEDLDWAMDMVNSVNLGMTSIPTEDDRKYYVILFDEPGIKYETFEAIVNYIQQKTVWSFTVDPDESASTIYEYYKRGWSPYIRLFPGPELGYGDDEDTFKDSTGLYLNNPLVKIIRPY